MYNQERKAAFLKEVETKSSRELIEKLFIQASDFEERWGKDFTLFSQSELDEFIPSVSGIRFETAEMILSQLRRYAKWCQWSGYPVNDYIFSYEVDLSSKVRSCYVSSPEHLKIVLDHVFGHAEINSIEYVYKTYLWLAFIGFTETEAADIRVNDVDFKSECIRYGGRARQIYEDSMTDIRKACTLTEFSEFKRHNVMVPRAPGDLLLRGKPTKKSMTEAIQSTFRQTVSKRFKEAEMAQIGAAYVDSDLRSIQLSFKRILLSGMFYRAYQREQVDGMVNFDIVVDERYERDRESYAHNEDVAGKMKYHMKRGYLEDYRAWKCAFSI